jgi:uroporphyrinogen-III decarboxylase
METGIKWEELTPGEKREKRFANWLEAPGVKFNSPEARQAYRDRVTRLTRTLMRQEPDRVPVSLPAGGFPVYYAGANLHQAMYDPELVLRAGRKYINDFKNDMDYFVGTGISSGRYMEIIDYKLAAWPGHGVGENASAYQFVEGENMKAGEYDALIKDPSDWALRVFLPRVIGAFEPFKNLPPLVSLLGFPTMFATPAAMPQVREAYQAMIDAGIEQEKMQKANLTISRKALAAGLPSMRGDFAMAPFDTLGDLLRGTKEIMMDMFRRPQKVHQALEKITELTVERYKTMGKDINALIVTFPLHKGDDTFMSDKQFATFYWPTLREVILGIIKEGLMVTLFAEGSYNHRLKQVTDLPEGWVNWHFDRTDMAKAKEILGGQCCLIGNVPASLMCTGTPRAVKDYCRKLIESCKKGGGYILAGGASASQTRPANLHAMMAAAKEYGMY